MKIGGAPRAPVNAVQPIKKVSLNSEELQEDAKEKVKDSVLQYIAELQAKQNDTGEDNPKVQQIMDKFKSGKKLTPEEMNYIRQHAPGLVESIQHIMREREMLELAMRLAPTKADVSIISLQATKNLERQKHSNPEDIQIRAKHLLDAMTEYQKTDEYKNKPDHMNDTEGKDRQKKVNLNIQPYSIKSMLLAYEQYKTIPVLKQDSSSS